MKHYMIDKSVMVWHRTGHCYAIQGIHRAVITYVGDPVRDAVCRRLAEVKALAALVRAKIEHQNLSRPPAQDSRPRRCHAKPMKGKVGYLGCRQCGQSWKAFDMTYPGCKE